MSNRRKQTWSVRGRGALSLLAALCVTMSACGTDASDDTITAPTPATSTAPEPAAPTPPEAPTAPPQVDVVATDSAYEGIPESVPVGTSFNLINESTSAYHSMGIIKLSPSDTRTLDEFAALAVDEIFADDEGHPRIGTAQAILGARPGEETSFIWNSAFLYGPGRYLILDAIPTGADPLEVEAEITATNFVSQIDGVDAHYQRGMIALVVVEE